MPELLTARIIDSLSGLEAMAPEWSRLHSQCPGATPFQSPQWLLPWTRYLFKGGKILTIALHDRGTLVGLAPLFCWGIERQTLSFLGAGISDYGDILFAPGRERDCLAAISHCLTEARRYWDLVDLQEIPAASILLAQQDAQPCSVCPVLELSEYPQSMEHKHRTDLRRAQNKLLKHAGPRFEMADQTNCTLNLEEFMQLHQTRWGPLDPSLRCFHREAVNRFSAAGQLRLALLRIDASPAAAIYAFRTGSTLYCYLSGFDPALARWSPGAVLLGWLIDQSIAEGITAVDFLRQPETYKYLWGARDRINYRVASLRFTSIPAISSMNCAIAE